MHREPKRARDGAAAALEAIARPAELCASGGGGSAKFPLGAAAPPRRPRRGGSLAGDAAAVCSPIIVAFRANYRQLSRFITRAKTTARQRDPRPPPRRARRDGLARSPTARTAKPTREAADAAELASRGRAGRHTAHRAQRLVGAPSAARPPESRPRHPPVGDGGRAQAADAAEHVALAPPAGLGGAEGQRETQRLLAAERARRAPRRRRADRARCGATARPTRPTSSAKSSSSAKPSVGSPASTASVESDVSTGAYVSARPRVGTSSSARRP